jgi:hypothetical protein
MIEDKYHYICKDKDGKLFMTDERCVDTEDAKQYVGENEVLYPFIEDKYNECLKPDIRHGMIKRHTSKISIVTQHIEDIPKKTLNTLGGGFVTPFITTQSLGDINPYLQDLLLNENFIPYNLTKPPKANYILFQLKKDLLSEQFIWEIEKPLAEQNDETKQAILDVLQ